MKLLLNQLTFTTNLNQLESSLAFSIIKDKKNFSGNLRPIFHLSIHAVVEIENWTLSEFLFIAFDVLLTENRGLHKMDIKWKKRPKNQPKMKQKLNDIAVK